MTPAEINPNTKKGHPDSLPASRMTLLIKSGETPTMNNSAQCIPLSGDPAVEPPTPDRPPLAARLRLPRWFTPRDRESRAGWRALRRAVADVPRDELPELLDDLHRKVVSHVEYDPVLGDIEVDVFIYSQFPRFAPAELGEPTALVARCVQLVREAGGHQRADVVSICRQELHRERTAGSVDLGGVR